MIKAILFDLWGVLIPEMATTIDAEIAKTFGIPYQSYLKKINELKPLVRKGRITLLDMYSEITKSFGKCMNQDNMLRKHIDLYKKLSTKRNDNVIMLIEKLKSYYQVYCITETEKEIAEINKNNGLFNYFAKTYLSVDLDYTKSEPEMYLKVLEDLGNKPDEVMLIDDRIECITVAKSIGIRGMLFKNIGQLKDELHTNKIL